VQPTVPLGALQRHGCLFFVMTRTGKIQRGIRRALMVQGEATTAELLRWCYPRGPGRDRYERKNRYRAIRGAADKAAGRTVRMRTICRPVGLSRELAHIARRADLLGLQCQGGSNYGEQI
jgi:hypothetical protein